MPLRRSNSYDLDVPFVRWDIESWYEPSFFNEQVGKRITNPEKRSAKEMLLRRSLELIRRKSENGSVCGEIFFKAFRAGLFDLAQEAFLTFSDETELELYQACSAFFEYVAVYRHTDAEFASICERRVQGAPEGGWDEYRSRALGHLGQYYFFTGNPRKAAALWNSANHRIEVDQVIVGMCEIIVEKAPSKRNLRLL